MNEDIFADDMFAVSDEEHHNSKASVAPTDQHSPPPPLHAEPSASKRKADHQAAAIAESNKRLRSTGHFMFEPVVLTSCGVRLIRTQRVGSVSPAAPFDHHVAKDMVYKFDMELAAAEDKGSRVDMEGTAKVNCSCCRVVQLKHRHDNLTTFLYMQTYMLSS